MIEPEFPESPDRYTNPDNVRERRAARADETARRAIDRLSVAGGFEVGDVLADEIATEGGFIRLFVLDTV